MLEQSRAILARLRVAHGEVRALREGNAHVVRVGFFQGLGSLVAGALVRRFPLNDPGVQLQMIHAISDEELLDPLSRGEIDLAFVTLPLEPGPLAVEEILAEELLLVVGPNDPLARAGNVSPSDLDGLRLVCLRRCHSTDQVLARLDANGSVPKSSIARTTAARCSASSARGRPQRSSPSSSSRATRTGSSRDRSARRSSTAGSAWPGGGSSRRRTRAQSSSRSCATCSPHETAASPARRN